MKKFYGVLLFGVAGVMLGSVGWSGVGTGGNTLLGAPPQASPGKSRLPSAAKRFAAVYKNFRRANNYQVSVRIEGGISGTPNHSIRQRSVIENYSGEVFGKLMHIPATPRAFRTLKSGAIFTAGGWKNIRANRQGNRLDRLFSFPRKLFDRASKYARRARYLADSEVVFSWRGDDDLGLQDDDDDSPLEDDEDSGDTEKDDGKRSRGPTAVKKGDTDVTIPRFIRITTPPKQALTHFIEVENSGCMSAG